MDSKNKVSVIVPVYNGEKYLIECIESIINQTYKNIEIIIIDDGSSDNSINIINAYKENDERIKLYTQKNKGVSEARNLGLKEATGEYIAFVDCDDYISSNMYNKLIYRMEESNSDGILCSFKRVYNGYSEKEVLPFDKETVLVGDDIFNKLTLNFISGEDEKDSYIMATIWRCIFRKDIINKYNIKFDTELSYAEDTVFCLNYFSKCNKVYIYNSDLYYYRYNINSAVNKYDKNLWSKNLQVNKKIEEMFKDNHMALERANCRIATTSVGCMVNVFHKDNKDSLITKYKNVREIIKSDRMKEMRSNYTIKNKKYKLLTSKNPLIPYFIIAVKNK